MNTVLEMPRRTGRPRIVRAMTCAGQLALFVGLMLVLALMLPSISTIIIGQPVYWLPNAALTRSLVVTRVMPSPTFCWAIQTPRATLRQAA